MAKRVAPADRPVRITTVGESPGADVAARQRRYVISMSIRTLCFISAVLVGDGWLRWVLIAGAVFLPYVAVVMANAPSRRPDGFSLLGPSRGRNELPRGGQHPQL